MDGVSYSESLTEQHLIPERPKAPRSGIHAALWIPTSQDGVLKRESLARHLDWLKGQGIHGILALGSTGEFARMDLLQRETILAAVIELASPLPVMANISSIRLDEVIHLGKAAARLGACGVAIMPPSFFPLSQSDILEFFLRAANHVPLPFYLYNYPEVTGNRIGVDVISQFADRAPMAGIKQSGLELDYHRDLISLGKRKGYSVFTAADPELVTYLEMGAVGCIGGLVNFAPELMIDVYDAHLRKTPFDAAQSSSRLREIGHLCSQLMLPLNVRSGMEARGFDPGDLKSVFSSQTLEVYQRVVRQFSEAFRAWGLPCIRA